MSYTPPSLDITVTTGGGDASSSVGVDDDNGFDIEEMAINSFPANFWIGNGISNIVLNGTLKKLEYSSSNEAGTATLVVNAAASVEVTALESGSPGVSSETLTITQYTDENGPANKDLIVNVARPVSAIYSSSAINVNFPLGATAWETKLLTGVLVPADIASINITNWTPGLAVDLGMNYLQLYFQNNRTQWDAANTAKVLSQGASPASGLKIVLYSNGGLPGVISRDLDIEYTMNNGTVHSQTITVNITRENTPGQEVYTTSAIDFNFPLGSTTAQTKSIAGVIPANHIESVNISNWAAGVASDLAMSYLYLYFQKKRSRWNLTSAGAVSPWSSWGNNLKLRLNHTGGLSGLTSRVLNVEYTLIGGTIRTQAITVNVTRPEEILTVVPDLALEAVIHGGVIVQPLTLSLDIRDNVEGIVRIKPLQLKLKISRVESIKTQDLKLVLFTDANAFSFSESSNWCGQSI
ncbi:MAG: hypothetical protein KAH03_06245 [Cocleimonas sp.]|nr:hypothetical protein [Cocleimonas sp.]